MDNHDVAEMPEPADHAAVAEQLLRQADEAYAGEDEPFEKAFLATSAAQTRALLALNDTISRLGVRIALNQAVAIGAIPNPHVLADDERRLLRDIAPDGALLQTERDEQSPAAAEAPIGGRFLG